MKKWNLIFITLISIIQFLLVLSKNLQYSSSKEKYEFKEETNITCPENCKDGLCDNVTLKCDSCIDGYFTDNCTEPCPTKKCLKCEQKDGDCELCQDNLTVIDNFCCELICEKCNDTGCTICKDKTKYGIQCNNNCPENCYFNSDKRKCDQDSGDCFSCISGKTGIKCDKDCNIGCNLTLANCDMKNGNCLCKEGYYGEKCGNTCDENCKKCDSKNGTCYQCSKGYYPEGKNCLKCPENCEGECPDGKCLVCKKGFYGEICDKECSIFCKDNICDKKTGSCECINHFSKEKNCTECLNKYDISTNCTECLGNYDIDQDCKTCIENYNITENCEGCINNYNISTSCEECNDHFSLKSNCTQCEKNYDINQGCKICIGNYSITDNCEKCIKNYNLSTSCEKCNDHFTLESKCTKCEKNYDIDQGCKTCIGNYNITENCEECINNYDISTSCEECKEHFTLESKCTKCEENYDISQDCKTCLENYNITENCEECINNYNISTLCTECNDHFTLESNCMECEENYDINQGCKICIGNYNITENCEECINNYNISTLCTECNDHFTLESNCTQCEKNYDINQNCEECINYYNKSSDCTICLIGYYGDECNESCYEGCNTSTSNCRKEDGYCNECFFPYYGDKCESKSEINNCVSINKTNGECLKCADTFYLVNNTCQECSMNCKNSLCEDQTGKCISCASFNAYGDICEKNCSKFCVSKVGENICFRENGTCFYGCIAEGNFSDNMCINCTPGYYPRDKGCTTQCSSHCQEICQEIDGSCPNCLEGYWDRGCNSQCNSSACKNSCNKITGFCDECNDGWYKDGSSEIGCKLCPLSCLKCLNASYCEVCHDDGKYGRQCDKNCSQNCDGNQCEIDGNCLCKKNYYGEQCSMNCDGCGYNGCHDKTGTCKDHNCSNEYFDPRMCNRKCGNKCGGKGRCDLFTGECSGCEGPKWGINCEKECSKECENDGRVDCCYVKENQIPKGIKINIIEKKKSEGLLGEEQDEFYLFNINLGGFDLVILADFETNSPLVIFDSNTEIKKTETEIYNISIDTKYNSSKAGAYIGEENNFFFGYDGFILTKEKSAKDKLIIEKDNIFNNFTFLICQEFKIEKDFDAAGKINGIVGLGLRNYFTEDLFWNNSNNSEKKLPKNLLVKSKDNSIYIGDYNDEIKNSFSKLSTMEIDNKEQIVMNKTIDFETSFTGIAYSLRKAYRYIYDKKVTLNNRVETTIVFNNIYKQFFEKIYFGDLFENGCHYRLVQGGEGEYYCDSSKKQAILNLPKLGLILGDYIYYLSYQFLYKESGQFITFIIKLNAQSQQKIILGKSFFKEFSVVYNNGNETLNFFGDIKKLNVILRDPDTLLNIDSDIFTPGGWVTLIIFIITLFIIVCYLSKYCCNKSDNEDSEDDEIDEEDDPLIDDTLE